MKRNTITATIALAGALALCSFAPGKEKGYTVSGNIKGLKDQELYLTYGTLNHSTIDTLVTHNGSFSFKGTTPEPMAAMLFTKDYRVKIDFYIENGSIDVKANIDSIQDARVKGPAVTNEFARFNDSIWANRKVAMQLAQKAYDLKTAGDTVNAALFQQQFETKYNSEFVFRRMYIENHPKSYVALHELQFYASDKTLDNTRKYYAAFDNQLKETIQGKEIAGRIATLGRIEAGKQAPAFVQDDVNGQPVALNSYKGKYVLLEFWASWCHPCRGESPNLVKQYKNFNSRGFEILSVSLDNVKDNWKEAIAKDGLLWTQVCDLKGWKNDVATLYGIQAVPANFLIDPNGKIVAADLRGEALEKKLTELFQ